MTFYKARKSHWFKTLSVFTLFTFLFEIGFPIASHALTSGPGQPESQSFQQASASNMVDLFTGDFSYNIPLFDIGGYPVNLTYDANVSMDDEASWVGLGWNLNPGAINRTMRGLPDDFKPSDEVEVTTSSKPSRTTTVGVSATADEIFGIPFNKNLGTRTMYSIEVFHNNYTGIGYQAKLSYAEDGVPLAGEVAFNSQSGLDISPQLNYCAIREFNEQMDVGTSYNLHFAPSATLNSRRGVQNVSFGTVGVRNVSMKNSRKYALGSNLGLGVSFSRLSGIPTVESNSYSSSLGFSVQVGEASKFKFKGKIPEIPVSVSEQGNLQKENNYIPYGYLYHTNSSALNKHAIFDIDREEDLELNNNSDKVGLPIQTYDLFNVSGQGVGGQIRIEKGIVAHIGEAGRKSVNIAPIDGLNLGFEIGLPDAPGKDLHVGLDPKVTEYNDESGMWLDFNHHQKNLSSQGKSVLQVDPTHETSYMKFIGAQSLKWESSNTHNSTDALQIGIATAKSNITHDNWYGTKRYDEMLALDEGGNTEKDENGEPILKTLNANVRDIGKRELRSKSVSYLTATEAGQFGLIKSIENYPLHSSLLEAVESHHSPIPLGRTASHRKKHHISEIEVVNESGGRYIYGLPVYNVVHQETSFSVDVSKAENAVDRTTGLVEYTETDNSVNNEKGIDNYYHSKTVSPFSTSFLLSAVVSSDYEDVDQNGPTDNDMGSFTKFNYSKLNQLHQWRAPMYTNDINDNKPKASYNPGHLAQENDDKASYSYGAKEVWYVHSIESKSEIAIFYLSDREDGLGANADGEIIETTKLKKLDKIEIYTKNQWLKYRYDPDPDNPIIPIKTIHFAYSYDLCPNVPNNTGTSAGVHPLDGLSAKLGYDSKSGASTTTYNRDANAKGGKLTLHKVWFTYGNNSRGAFSPYIFQYGIDTDGSENANWNPSYYAKSIDRWGSYRPQGNLNGSTAYGSYAIYNDDFPYTGQPNDGYRDGSWGDDLNDYAHVYKMNQIILPTGAKIRVEYESDDYAHVQDQDAMQMVNILGFANGDKDFDPNNALSMTTKPKGELYRTGTAKRPNNHLIFSIDPSITDVSNYIPSDIKEIYASCFVQLNKGSEAENEYVNGYYQIEPNSAKIIEYQDNGNTVKAGCVELKASVFGGVEEPFREFNPITQRAFDFMKKYRTDIAVKGSNTKQPGTNAWDIAEMLVSFIPEVYSMIRGHDFTMRVRNLARKVTPENSWIRVKNPYGKKYGGGSRVKRILIKDELDHAENAGVQLTGESGIEYDYTHYDKETQRFISSGVASYEPQMGGEENALKGSNPITNKIIERSRLTPNQRFNLSIGPVGETFYPFPSVGYQQVTVRSLLNTDINKHTTGRSVHQFYTARDFPTRSFMTEIENKHPQDLGQIIGFSKKFLVCSQAFYIETNDMHGKPKAQWEYAHKTNTIFSDRPFAPEYNDGEGAVSGVEYLYHTDSERPDRLASNIPYLDKETNRIDEGIFGVESNIVIDSREKASTYSGIGAQLNFDVVVVEAGAIVPSFTVLPSLSTSFNKIQSVAVTKVIHRTGILHKTIVHTDGASLATENLAYDIVTGLPLLTKTQTEYDEKYNYSLSIPAHWADKYKTMGAACTNIGLVLNNYSIDSYGIGDNVNDLLVPGDELIDVNKGVKLWVLDAKGTKVSFIDQGGEQPASGTDYSLKVVRSGNRNHLGSVLTQIVHNGEGVGTEVDDNIDFYDFEEISPAVSNVLSASAIGFSDRWQAFVSDGGCNTGLYEYFRKRAHEELAKVIAQVMEDVQSNNNGYFTSAMNDLRTNKTKSSFLNRDNPEIITVYSNGQKSHGFTDVLLNAMETGLINCDDVDYIYGKPISQVDISLRYVAISDTKALHMTAETENASFDFPQSGPTNSFSGNFTGSPVEERVANVTPCIIGNGEVRRKEYIDGLEINVKGITSSSDYELNFLTHLMEEFVTTGIGSKSTKDQESFMNLSQYEIDYKNSVGNGTYYSLNTMTDVLTFTAPHAQNDITFIQGAFCSNGGNTALQEYVAFMDAMVASDNANNRDNALWEKIEWVDHNGLLHQWHSGTPPVNQTYSDFGTLHSEIDLSKGYDALFSEEFYLTGTGTPQHQGQYSLVFPYETNSSEAKYFITVPKKPEGCEECANKLGAKTNPYLTNTRGNWLPYKQLVFTGKGLNTMRSSSSSLVDMGTHVYSTSPQESANNTDISEDGFYEDFQPYYIYSGSGNWEVSASTNSWQSPEEITQKLPSGPLLESKNIIGIPSAAIFGYQQHNLAICVASNASINDIANDNFEEYKTDYPTSIMRCNLSNKFTFYPMLDYSTITISEEISHTGLSSMQINPGADGNMCIVRQPISSELRTAELEEISNSGSLNEEDDLLVSYKLKTQDEIRMFSPNNDAYVTQNEDATQVGDRKYIVSFWVFDPGDNLNLTFVKAPCGTAGSDLLTTPTISEAIDGWKRMEYTFEMPPSGTDNTSLQISLLNTGSEAYYIDDFRIFPKRGNMKSFVYHPYTFRLMAQLDENNFATFFEYDEQGNLVRTNVETEKGILTVSEQRASVRLLKN